MSKYCNDPNRITSSNVVNCPNIVNDPNVLKDPNIVNSSNVVNDQIVVNCPYKWAECSKLSNCCKWSKCCDKMLTKKKKHHTLGTIPKSTTSILVVCYRYFNVNEQTFPVSPQNVQC